jgi:protein SCO1/2
MWTVLGSVLLFVSQAQASAPHVTGDSTVYLADIGAAPTTVLVDSTGRAFDLKALCGKVVVVSFVYTTCAGSCPATAQALAGVRRALRAARLWGSHVEFVSISLDPERDTTEVLARYGRNLLTASDPAWHFLTGPQGRVDRTITAWGMWARRNGSGVLDHPSRVFLVDPQGHEREIYSLEFLTPESVLQDIRSLLAEAKRE